MADMKTDNHKGAHKPGEQGAGGKSDEAKKSAADLAKEVSKNAGDQLGGAAKMASDTLDTATEFARDSYGRAAQWAEGSYGRGRDQLAATRRRSSKAAGQAGRTLGNYASENPVMVGVVGLAAGLLIGALLPRTRHEDEVFGEWSDELKSEGARVAHEAAERGREYVEEAFTGDDPQFGRHEVDFRHDEQR
jgi:ElaB/YqjD/DUF883 family membrane-anchored ribosome-binding protein